MKKVKVDDLVIGRIYDVYYEGELIIKGKELSRAIKFFFNFSDSFMSQGKKGIIRKEEVVDFESSYPYNYPSVHTTLSFGNLPLELNVRFGQRANIQHLEFHEYIQEETLKELAEKETKLLKELAEIQEAQKRLKFSF